METSNRLVLRTVKTCVTRQSTIAMFF